MKKGNIMKSLKTAAVAALLTQSAIFASPALAQGDLPASGTYFIVNCKTEQAVTPLAVTPGNNVFANEFNKSGVQKFTIERKVDLKTKQPTNRYTIKAANEEVTLYLAPHDMSVRTAIMDSSPSTYVLKPSDGAIVVESLKKSGDAMFTLNVPPCTEVRFGPNDGSDKYKWKFVPVQ